MSVLRARHVLLLLGIVGGSAESVIACSSDARPPAGGGGTSGGTGGGGDATTDAGALSDSAADRDSGADATDERPLTDEGACLNDKPAPTIDGGFTGGDDAGTPICPATGTCVTYCNDVVAHYKLGVAQVAVTCLRKLPSCADVLDVTLCVDNALGGSCKDTTSPAYCKPLVKPCDPNAGEPGSLIDEPGCESFANGLSASGRDALSTGACFCRGARSPTQPPRYGCSGHSVRNRDHRCRPGTSPR